MPLWAGYSYAMMRTPVGKGTLCESLCQSNGRRRHDCGIPDIHLNPCALVHGRPGYSKDPSDLRPLIRRLPQMQLREGPLQDATCRPCAGPSRLSARTSPGVTPRPNHWRTSSTPACSRCTTCTRACQGWRQKNDQRLSGHRRSVRRDRRFPAGLRKSHRARPNCASGAGAKSHRISAR